VWRSGAEDREGAGRTLLIVVEQMTDQLDELEHLEIAIQLERLLGDSQQASIRERLRKNRERIAELQTHDPQAQTHT